MKTGQDDTITLGTFILGSQEFGVGLLQQREVLRMMPVTKVPCALPFIEGVVNLRGLIIPVVNLRTRFRMPPKEFTRQTRIINIEINDSFVVGFIVDSVGQVRRVERSQIEPPPAVIASVESEYICGVAKFDSNILIMLDVAKILSAEDLQALDSLA